MTSTQILDKTYYQFLNDLKNEIAGARIRAHLTVNKELIHLYWKIGKMILDRQSEKGWGTKIVDHLSQDLQLEFPSMKGFGPRNLKYMRLFAQEYPQEEIVQEVLAQLTWYHNITLLDKVKNSTERLWYVQKAVENGWSRNVMVHQISLHLYERQGKGLTNFKETLPTTQSDLAHELIKSSYNLEFLDIEEKVHERHLENALVTKIRDFLLELGSGFAFMGNQYRVIVEDEEFFIDLLFYNTRLRCYFVIELKTGKFLPEYAGKLGFYLTLIDKQIKHKDDNPTIGLILCQSAKNVVVEYSLSGNIKPMGVSQFKLSHTLPKKYKDILPSPEALENLIQQELKKEEQ